MLSYKQILLYIHKRRLQNTFIMLETCLVHLGKCFWKTCIAVYKNKKKCIQTIFDYTCTETQVSLHFLPLTHTHLFILMCKMYNFILAPLKINKMYHKRIDLIFLTFMTLIFLIFIKATCHLKLSRILTVVFVHFITSII